MIISKYICQNEQMDKKVGEADEDRAAMIELHAQGLLLYLSREKRGGRGGKGRPFPP